MIPWAVRYYRDQRGRLPVADFFALPSVIGITKVERVEFFAYLVLVGSKALGTRSRSFDPARTAESSRSRDPVATSSSPIP